MYLLNTTPYTYLIGWPKLNVWYYGVRYAEGCHPKDLWTTYFTSSKYVTEFVKIHGEPTYRKVRRTFTIETIPAARLWEHRVLRRMKVVQKAEWLNKNDRMAPPLMRGDDNPSKLPGVGKKISDALTGVPKSDEHKKNLSLSHIDGKLSGKTYEEIHGDVRAQELKELRAKSSAAWERTIEYKKNSANGQRGKRWITDGVIAKPLYPGDPMPNGFKYGRLPCSEESKRKNRESQAGKPQVKVVSRLFDRKLMTIANYFQWANDKYKNNNKKEQHNGRGNNLR